jgi:hypothetical protein
MAAETEFTIGAKASCSDGPCGVVRGLVIGSSGTITHLVIEPEHDEEAARRVPLGLAETTGGGVRLDCTLVGFGQLDRAEERMVPPDMTKASIEVSALGPIYAAERADNSAGEVFAVLGAGVAYIAATIAFSSRIFRSIGWLGPLLPIPLWIIAAYQSLSAGGAMLRSLSVREIENRLLKYTNFTSDQYAAIGLRASDKIMNVMRAGLIHKAANIAAYGGILAMITAYTIYIILKDPHLSSNGRNIAYIFYGLGALLVLGSYISSFIKYNNSKKLFP